MEGACAIGGSDLVVGLDVVDRRAGRGNGARTASPGQRRLPADRGGPGHLRPGHFMTDRWRPSTRMPSSLSIAGLRIAGGAPDRLIRCCYSTAFPDRWRVGCPFIDLLDDRTVITFDAPGVGASETPVVPYSMPMLSDVAARVLDAVGIENADVVGFSYGGAVAQQFAVGHPTRVNRLVLLSTACGVGAVPGRSRDVTRILLTPSRGTRWPRPHPWACSGSSRPSRPGPASPFSAVSMHPPW